MGLLGVLSAKQMGAERIIAMSRHETRQKLAREFGATDIVTERGDEGVARIKELTKGIGADSVLECVGTQESMMQAIRSTRTGGYVSYVGVPHGVELTGEELFFAHVHLHGGPAPVRRYLPELIDLVLEPEDRPRQGLRPDAAPRPGGGGLPRDGRAPRDQDAAAPVRLDRCQEGTTMTAWPKDELHKIAEADDLHVSPFREDGVTYGTPTWIWSVAVDGALYVRAYNGQDSRWYQAAMRQKAGRITAAGMTKEVAFEPVDGPINDLIDDAYRAKYQRQPVPRPDDQRPRPLRDGQGHAARHRCLIVAQGRCAMPEKFHDLRGGDTMARQAAGMSGFDFSDAMVVVTGAAAGIGLGIAQAFHAAGGRVALGDLRKEAVERAAAGLGGERAFARRRRRAGREIGAGFLRGGGAGAGPRHHRSGQRRHCSELPGARHVGRGMGPRDGDQPARGVPYVPGGGAKHEGRRAPRQDHHDLLRRLRQRSARRLALLRLEGRHRHVHQGAGHGVGRAAHQRELHRSRLYRYQVGQRARRPRSRPSRTR